jgi:hypothetical protein
VFAKKLIYLNIVLAFVFHALSFAGGCSSGDFEESDISMVARWTVANKLLPPGFVFTSPIWQINEDAKGKKTYEPIPGIDADGVAKSSDARRKQFVLRLSRKRRDEIFAQALVVVNTGIEAKERKEEKGDESTVIKRYAFSLPPPSKKGAIRAQQPALYFMFERQLSETEQKSRALEAQRQRRLNRLRKNLGTLGRANYVFHDDKIILTMVVSLDNQLTH